ncbi:hypothetical protein H9639_14275 [Arthrobacter sp. Sa2CUA1]|uniref:Uncharacterized protein n=1 Tax=Arthrobacter gallicola TaxID=2762225 RepID=A0ABR8UVA6_9MICC|nr:hypothetical protein [Arthrobacter gallicola]MBD7996463.1 hypothetical protein [Arthrobacter gallicola]
MMHDSSDVEIVLSENGALVAGPDEAVEALLARLDLPQTSAKPVGRSVKNLFVDLTSTAAIASAYDPKWVRMTSESYGRVQELGGIQLTADGLFSGVLRGDMGRIDSILKFDLAGGMNPAMLAQTAALAQTMALRHAIDQLESLVETMDVKLDILLEDNRNAAIGDVQGLTHVLSRAYAMYEKSGRISETVWSQIAGHASALAQAEAKARAHIESVVASVGAPTFGDRADAIHRAADGEIQHWLVILAAVDVNQQRLDVLELAHLRERDADAVVAHAEAARAALEDRRRILTDTVQRLSDALAITGDVSDVNRVRNPLRSRKLIREAEHALKLVSAFAEVTGIEVTAGELEQEPWRKSVVDLAKDTVSEAKAVAVAVPREISRRREDNLIRKVNGIQERRALAESSSDAIGSAPEQTEGGGPAKSRTSGAT